MLRTACLILALGVASCQLAEKAAAWPKDPVGDPASLLFRQLQARLGVKEEMIVDATPQRRILKGQSAPPSYDDIATFNIILFSSIALVFVFYFSIMAMVDMDYQSDSLLYSKAKTE